MGNQAGGVKDRHPSDGGGGGVRQGGGQESKRIEEMVAPLCTARLRPTRQKTKNAVANITGSGEVCMEFLKMRRGEERVVEVMRRRS